MNDSSSLERRYSFNMAQGGHIAESTHLNGSTFSWGSVSPKLRSYSNLNNSTNSNFNGDSIANSKNMPVTKVDARIAADVQSKGLASRIVKYHESGTRLNRSISAHNLFSKPGQFPAVTLKKTNLPYRAAKRELSMIRIPPPDKSSFYGNTVSSLLRSSSVIGLHSKQNEVLSTENRPIIHPPPTENEMAPTRSVLDVLKEISRKRINSDELESEETTLKKYCSRASNDFVDTVANSALANQQDCLGPSSFSPCQRYKRQRDCITPHQGIQLVDARTSPEQVKKRVCNYNNDITSSLSSTVKSKKITPRNLNSTLPQSYETQNLNSKNIDIRLKNLENNWRNSENLSTDLSETSIDHEQNKNAVEPQRSVSEPFFNSDEKGANGLTRTVHKQRLTLFNKKCDDNETLQTSDPHDIERNNLDNFNEEDCTGIPFVKPKKIASKSGLRNPVMERTQKSKLALMLSGLRGEIYQNPDLDELDCSSEKKNLQTTESNSTSIPTSSFKSTKNMTTLTATTTTTTVTSTSSVETMNVKTSLSSQPTLTANKTSPLVGLKLKASTILSTEPEKNTDLQSKPDLPVLGGFSFSTNNSNGTSVVQTLCSKNESKITPAQIASTPISTSLTENMELPINNNLVKFPAVSKALVIPTSNSNTAITSSSLTIGKTFTNNLNTPAAESSTSLPFSDSSKSSSALPVPISFSAASSSSEMFGTSTVSVANSVNSFNFTVPCTSSTIPAVSSALIMTGSSTNSATLTKTTVSSGSSFRSTSNPLIHFSTKSSNLEMANTSSEGIPSFSFNIDTNKTAKSINALGTAKTLVTGPGFTFNTDVKIQGSTDQSNQKAENKGFNSSTLPTFDSQRFITKTTESSILNNVTRSSESNVFHPSGVPSFFGSNSVKAGTDVFGSNPSSSSAAFVTTRVNGDDKTGNNKSMPFSFGSNTVTFAAKSSNNLNTNTGGFSFSSATSNNGASGQKNTLTNTFSGASGSVSQSTFMFGSPSNQPNTSNIFSASSNKQNESISQGGFSFGSAPPLKTSSFSFNGGKNDVISANKAIPSFVAPSDAKQNMLSTNKPFSFGSPQPMHQKQSESTNSGNSLNIFALSSATKATQPPAFNFTSGNAQPNVPTTNMFAPPSSNVTTGPGDRPIRRATRRLQK